MPLRADRIALEWFLRIVVAGAMAWLLAGAFMERRTAGGEIVELEDLPASLERWTVRPPADTLGLQLASAPDQLIRDYLRALRSAGTTIAWSNEGIGPVMLEGEPLEDPAGGAMVRLAGEGGSVLTVSDSLGLLDSIEIDAFGSSLRVPAYSGAITAGSGATVAATIPANQTDRSVVVLGLAGWESKFTIRALEERGWKVESRIALAPRLGTGRGTPFPLDTARHAAVIALDSSAAAYSRDIYRFVQSGGGLILGDAASPYFQRAAPAGTGSFVRPARLRVSGDFRRQLGFRVLTPLHTGASGLENRDGAVTLAAGRVGAGRVIQSGYRDTWRWRMEGGDNAVADHRAWWAGLVATIAYRSSGDEVPEANPAPLASLIQELGPPGTLPSGRHSTPRWPIILALLVVSLFGEWLSRRLRGAS